MSRQTKSLVDRVCLVVTWLMLLSMPVLVFKWCKDVILAAGKESAQLFLDVFRDEGARMIMYTGWVYFIAICSIPFILAYIGFAVFGYRISFKREARPLWRI